MTLLPVPRLIARTDAPPLRWGVVGSGWIAGAFTDALHAHTDQRMVTATARDGAKAAAFAAEHGIARISESVEALVGSPDIDVVYIATPHTSHREVALAAIAAGKHVLVEKPFALDAREARDIAEASRRAGVFAMEAMWTRYLPQSDILRQVLDAGTLGDIHLVTADFGFAAPFDADNRMWNPELGGGALLDAGVYPLSFVSSVLGAPTRLEVDGALTVTGVDARASLLLGSASGATALVATSMVSSMPVRATVIGSRGRVDVHSPFFGPSGVTIAAGSIGTEETETWTDTTFATLHEGLGYEATALASYVGEGRTESPLHTLDETISIIGTIDEARRRLGVTGVAGSVVGA
ncbi:Gfo/Idh/MocA family protein [Leifsonia poae]|uniref:Gfo/Idh/MocA family protein n=1 Tax=Leifsonia poae TaxID=110933 RepID=UPI001CBC8918|nr:Gfo/Idh/MocA family oxidoreductase [Leifsonia poae]